MKAFVLMTQWKDGDVGVSGVFSSFDRAAAYFVRMMFKDATMSIAEMQSGIVHTALKMAHRTDDEDYADFGNMRAWIEERKVDDYGLTDCLCERLLDNHSLSEFCTVLDLEECLRLYPEAARFKAELDETESRLEKQYQQYLCAQIPGKDASCQKAKNYRNGVNAIIGRTWSDVQNCIRWNHTDRGSDEDKALARERVKAKIEELRKKWDLKCERGWRELWQ